MKTYTITSRSGLTLTIIAANKEAARAKAIQRTGRYDWNPAVEKQLQFTYA